MDYFIFLLTAWHLLRISSLFFAMILQYLLLTQAEYFIGSTFIIIKLINKDGYKNLEKVRIILLTSLIAYEL